MSYGGQSNAPWQRNVMQGHPQSGGFHQNSQMFMQNAQQSNMAAFGHGGMQGGGGNMFPGGGAGGGNSVSYGQPGSGLNPVAFQQGGGSQSNYNSIGTVTKISNDCGLVNDEVFFYRNSCKGPIPKLGDRVLFEATYSSNGQFKWNATRVQLMQQPIMSSNKGGYNSVPPPNEYQRGQMRRSSPKRSPVRGRHERDHRDKERLHRSRDREEDEQDRKRRREDRGSRDRGPVANSRGGAANDVRSAPAARNEKERDRGEARKKEREVADREQEVREREKERAREVELHRAGPKSRRGRAIKRYMVDIPKSLLAIKTADVQDLRTRYLPLYIPSDFFHANIKWPESFPPNRPFSLRRPCQFHIMNEFVESPVDQSLDLLEPADANYLYAAKVMLLSLPSIAEIYKKCLESTDENSDHQPVHPSRILNFLVGVKGRVGSMAIGGPWSPSLDGENPDKDPSVLIRTAIRTCKALTGIDLSNCTQWYRFVELYYHRTEYKNMEKDGPPRVETVVIYLPDVHSCMPSIEEWQTLTQFYKNAANDVIARRSALVAAAAENANNDNENLNDVEMADNSALADEAAGEDAEENSNENEEAEAENDEGDENAEPQDAEEQEEKMDDSTASANTSGAVADDDDVQIVETIEGGGPAEDENAAVDENDEPAPEPTHYSLLDLKTMKVQEIRDELLARDLVDKGVRNVVMARLAKALNTEKAEELKNKSKNRQQKSDANKKPNAKKTDEKMEVDSDKTANDTNKKVVDESKKKKGGATAVAAKTNGQKEKTTKSPAGKNSVSKGKNEKEEGDWADVIDFELSDIVILDEYDSSKNNEETNLKEMTEKEKTKLIQRYTLPSTPHIIVHPNRMAKGGKFDCSVAPLSLLLDYHPDDSKERFFEASLFAELFNDMLMRDFAFNIYKEIYLYEDKSNANSTSEGTETKVEGGDIKKEKTGEKSDEIKKDSKEKENDKEKSSKKDSKSSNEEKSGKDQPHNDETQSTKSESRKRKLSTTTVATVNGKDTDLPPVSDKKMVVVKPQLLLSFVYFDTNYCGYIFEKDLEDLFMVLGLNLSRSQIKKVLGKLAIRHAVYYHKLTDKEETADTIPAIEDVGDLPIEELEKIAAGNNQYESVFGSEKSVNNQLSAIGNNDNEDGLINFNGTVVHVGKLLHQINRTEKNYSDLEKLYNDLRKQHGDLQKDHNKSSVKIKDLQTEIKTVSRKLTDANQDFYSLNRKFRDQNATLSYIYTRVAPYFVRDKEKDKESKAEGAREKDKDEKEKEKPKDKDGEKEKDKSKDEGKEKEKPKENKEKEKPKEEKEKEKPKEEDKEKEVKKDDSKNKEKAKEGGVTEKKIVKDEKQKEKVKEEKEKVKDEKEKAKEEKENIKEVKEKENVVVVVKADKEKEKPKVEKDNKEQPKIVKETVNKEKPKEEKTKEKAKEDNKVKPPATKEVKVKPTPQKNAVERPKTVTPIARKIADPKSATKIIKKTDIKK